MSLARCFDSDGDASRPPRHGRRQPAGNRRGGEAGDGAREDAGGSYRDQHRPQSPWPCGAPPVATPSRTKRPAERPSDPPEPRLLAPDGPAYPFSPCVSSGQGRGGALRVDRPEEPQGRRPDVGLSDRPRLRRAAPPAPHPAAARPGPTPPTPGPPLTNPRLTARARARRLLSPHLSIRAGAGQTDKFADLPIRGFDQTFITKSLQVDRRPALAVLTCAGASLCLPPRNVCRLQFAARLGAKRSETVSPPRAAAWMWRTAWRWRYSIAILTAMVIFVIRAGNEAGTQPVALSLKSQSRAGGSAVWPHRLLCCD